tara:strand:+ start:1526 stop:1981 length:456 start_codon:yes stop_codon:yes gene_type:complete
MISLLGSLLGFTTSFLPSILDVFKQAQAHKQKLEMMKLQGELLEKKSALRIQELDKQAEIKEVEGLYKHDASLDGGKFVNGLRSSVRPVITYIFMGLFIAVEISIIVKFMETGGEWTEAVNLLWSDEVAGLWSAILAFWFGNRAISKFQGK